MNIPVYELLQYVFLNGQGLQLSHVITLQTESE